MDATLFLQPVLSFVLPGSHRRENSRHASVSYTHLDVYKRQGQHLIRRIDLPGINLHTVSLGMNDGKDILNRKIIILGFPAKDESKHIHVEIKFHYFFFCFRIEKGIHRKMRGIQDFRKKRSKFFSINIFTHEMCIRDRSYAGLLRRGISARRFLKSV